MDSLLKIEDKYLINLIHFLPQLQKKKLNAKTSTLNNNPCDNDFSFKIVILKAGQITAYFLSPTTPGEFEEIVKNLENDKASYISISF